MLLNLLELKCNTFNSQLQAEYEFKIQMLVGKEAKTYFERFFKNLPSLVSDRVLPRLNIFLFLFRPDSLCTIPIKRGQADHKLAMSNFDEIFPEKDLKDYKLIFGVVIMEIDGEIPHFSLLVIGK